MKMTVAGFNWDEHNSAKCQKHGLTLKEIESVFDHVAIRPDIAHSQMEDRFMGIGRASNNRYVFVIFTLRTINDEQYIRPISARYMHNKEVKSYEEENSIF